MEILKIGTLNGYRLEVVCDYDECAWTGEVDPQQPIWAAFVALEGHITRVHKNASKTLVAVKGRVRRCENLELPECMCTDAGQCGKCWERDQLAGDRLEGLE